MKKVFLIIFIISFSTLASTKYECLRLDIKQVDGQLLTSYTFKQNEKIQLTFDKSSIKDIKITGEYVSQSYQFVDSTFENCSNVIQDGSMFSQNFEIECRGLSAYSGGPFTVDYDFIGLYAGISPKLNYNDNSKIIKGLKEIIKLSNGKLKKPNRLLQLFYYGGRPSDYGIPHFCYSIK